MEKNINNFLPSRVLSLFHEHPQIRRTSLPAAIEQENLIICKAHQTIWRRSNPSSFLFQQIGAYYLLRIVRVFHALHRSRVLILPFAPAFGRPENWFVSVSILVACCIACVCSSVWVECVLWMVLGKCSSGICPWQEYSVHWYIQSVCLCHLKISFVLPSDGILIHIHLVGYSGTFPAAAISFRSGEMDWLSIYSSSYSHSNATHEIWIYEQHLRGATWPWNVQKTPDFSYLLPAIKSD